MNIMRVELMQEKKENMQEPHILPVAQSYENAV